MPVKQPKSINSWSNILQRHALLSPSLPLLFLSHLLLSPFPSPCPSLILHTEKQKTLNLSISPPKVPIILQALAIVFRHCARGYSKSAGCSPSQLSAAVIPATNHLRVGVLTRIIIHNNTESPKCLRMCTNNTCITVMIYISRELQLIASHSSCSFTSGVLMKQSLVVLRRSGPPSKVTGGKVIGFRL